MLIPVKIPSRVELTKKLEIVNLDENDAHTLGLIIKFLFASSNCTVGGKIMGRSWFQLRESSVHSMGHDSIIVER